MAHCARARLVEAVREGAQADRAQPQLQQAAVRARHLEDSLVYNGERETLVALPDCELGARFEDRPGELRLTRPGRWLALDRLEPRRRRVVPPLAHLDLRRDD